MNPLRLSVFVAFYFLGIKVSISTIFKCAKEEYPVPKSSREIFIPISFNAFKT